MAKSKKETVHNPEGAKIIEAFIKVDPVNKKHYGHKGHRNACDFLIAEYGLELTLKVIALLPQTNKIPFFPIILTPFELMKNWVRVESKLVQIKNQKLSGRSVTY